MKTTLTICLIFCLNLHLAFGQSMNHWVEVGLKNSPTTAVQQAQIEAAEKAAESTYEWPETHFEFSAIEWMPNSFSPHFRPTASLSQDLPWFGTRKTKEKMASAEINYQKTNAQATACKLIEKIQEQYINLQHLQEKANLLEEHTEHLELALESLLMKLEAGDAGAWEVVLLENDINEAAADIKKTRYQLDQEKRGFQLLIGSKIENLKLDSLKLQKAEVSAAPEEHPNLRSLEAKREELSATKDQITIDYAPKLNIGIHYEAAMHTEPSFVMHDMLMPTVGVSFPLWTNKKKAKKELIKYQEQAINAEIKKEENRLNQEVIAAQENIFKLKTDWETQEKNIKNTQDALDLLWVEYEANRVSFKELHHIEAELISLYLNQLEAIKDYNQAQAYLTYLLAEEQISSKKQ